MTFWNKDKYVASLSSLAHSILVEEKTTGKGCGKNLPVIIFKNDDWNGSNKLCQCILQFVKDIATHGHNWLSILPTLL